MNNFEFSDKKERRDELYRNVYSSNLLAGESGELSPTEDEQGRSEEDFEEGAEETHEELEDDAFREFLGDDVLNNFNNAVLQLNDTAFQEDAEHTVIEMRDFPVRESNQITEGDEGREEAENAEREVNSEVDAIKEKNKRKRKQRNERLFTLAVGMIGAVTGSLSLAASNAIIKAIKDHNTDDLNPDIYPKEIKDEIIKFLQKYHSISDKDFWTNLGNFLQLQENGKGIQPVLTLSDQILFMNYVIDMFPAKEIFTWRNYSDRLNIRNSFVATYAQHTHHSSSIYFEAAKTKYEYTDDQGKKQVKDIPKSVMAEIIRLSLTYISVNPLTLRSLLNKHYENHATYSPIVQDVLGYDDKNYEAMFYENDYSVKRFHRKYQDIIIKGISNPHKIKIKDLTGQFLEESRNYYTRLYRAKFYLPEGETIQFEKWALLDEDIFVNGSKRFLEGTLVYCRTSNKADVVFILDSIIFNEHNHVLLHNSFLTKNNPLESNKTGLTIVRYPEKLFNSQYANMNINEYHKLFGNHLLGADANKIINGILSALGTLAFALPPPWGPVVSAGIGIIHMLFAASSTDNPFKQLLDGIAELIKAQELLKLTSNITNFSGYLNQQTSVLKDLSEDQAIDYVKDNLLGQLKVETTPSTSAGIYTPVYSLLNEGLANVKNDGDKLGQQALDTLLAGSLILSFAYKSIIQLHGLLAGYYQKKKDVDNYNTQTNLMYASLGNFVVSMTDKKDGLVSQIDKILNGIETRRINAISEVGSSFVYSAGGGIWQFRFSDSWTGYKYVKVITSSASNSDPDLSVPDKDHKNYVDKQRSSIQSWLSQKRLYKDKLKSVINTWNNFNIPNPPKDAIGKIDFSVSKTSTPKGSWVKGAKVRYAVKFSNDKGPSALGPWSEYVEVTDKAFPEIQGVPVDPLKLAHTRIIYRQFSDKKPEVAGGIPNNTTTTFRDTKN